MKATLIILLIIPGILAIVTGPRIYKDIKPGLRDRDFTR